MTKHEAILKQFKTAVIRLEEVLSIPKTEIIRDSAIKRFEFTLDLSWKLLKEYLESQKGIIVTSPKECFKEAFRQGIIDYDDMWLKMVEARNETAHTYNETTAEKVFNILADSLKLFKDLLIRIK
jgi:nucleotidyltransferase substrate binding protein (TIGR01987 family)